MAGRFDLPTGGSHPALLVDRPVAKGSYPTGSGDAIHEWFAPITTRLHEIMSSQYVPQTDKTLASLIKDANIFVSSRVIVHIKRYEGWVRDIFPLKEAPALFFKQRVWADVPQVMDDNPEGVAPQVMMTKFEDYWYALRRYNIGNKAKHESLLDPEGLSDWLFKQSKYPDAFFGTAELCAFDAIDYQPSSYKRQMDAQGHRKYGSVSEALTFETETYLIGLKPKGLYELFHMINQAIVAAAPDQDPFNRMVLPFGARQIVAHSDFETDREQRGVKAIRNLEGGGVAWQLAGMPGVLIYEAGKINYVNFANEYEPFKRTSALATYFMVDGRSGLRFDVDNYDPEGELSVMVRDSKVSPGLKHYGYEQALRDCHRFTEDGYLDVGAHEGMLRRLPDLMRKQGFQMYRQQDLDPLVWHDPTHPVEPDAPGYHVCELYGDVAEAFRGHQVDDKHGAAFSTLAHNYLGDDAVQKIEALREVINRLEKPPASLWVVPGGGGDTPMEAYLKAATTAATSALTEGAFDVPDFVEGFPALPYGYTTIAGVRALARKYESGPAGWSDEAQTMFRKANEAWPILKRLWALVIRTYPECLLVQNGRFVPDWMKTESEDMDALYSVLSNFFDTRVRYPVWILGGEASSAFAEADLRAIGVRSSLDRLAALNAGLVDDIIARKVKEAGDDLSDAYRENIGPWYQALVRDDAPEADAELETFVAREIDPAGISPEQKARIMSGILALAYEASFEGESVQTITRELINSWKTRDAPAGRPPVRGDAGIVNAVNTRLSFHPSIWKTAAARARGDIVAPADPTQRDRPLPIGEDGFTFARSAMPYVPRSTRRGTAFAPLDTRSGMDVDYPGGQDLGSLDELDSTQMLYPFLYQPDSNIFWKFQKTGPETGEHVKTYYFWHRIHHLRKIEPDQFAKLGTLCMLFSRISIPADLACVRMKIPPPDLCFIGTHFMIRQRTQGVIFAKGGGLAGATFWKGMDTLVGVDTTAKEWFSHFSAWMGTAILDPRYVVFHRDVFPAGGLTGYDTSSVPPDFSMEHVGLDKALMTFFVGSEFTRDRALSEANPFPLSGRYDPDYMGDVNFDDSTEEAMVTPDKPPFPGFWFYAYRHNLQDMHRMQKWSYESAAEEMKQIRYFPGIAYFEEHVAYSGNGEYKKRFEGSGHTRYWPDNIRDVSEGTHVFHRTEIRN